MKKTMLKWKTEEKTRENDKPRVVLKKGLGGGGRNEQNISRIAGNPLSVSAIIAPLLKKTTRIAGKTAFVVIISKQNNRHKQKKGRSTKKTEIKNTTTIKTPTTEKPGGPKCKKLGFGKGMRWNWP